MTVTANDRTYAQHTTCAVAICLDGCEPAYLEEAIARGLMPTLKRIRATGTDRLAHSVIPSFTNPNNMSIATGRPPVAHGICGNFLYDPETGEEVMMNDVRFLRAPTIFSQFYAAGARVAVAARGAQPTASPDRAPGPRERRRGGHAGRAATPTPRPVPVPPGPWNHAARCLHAARPV